jgi:broad specificity phosphatase PhoE
MPKPEHELVFVRHGQGSFFTGDYDQLTAHGEAQSAFLGDYWCRRKERFDAIYVGPRNRQQKTAVIVGECFRKAGLPWPEPQMLEELDEFHFQDLIDILLPQVAAGDDQMQRQLERMQKAESREEALESFSPLFEKLIRGWIAGHWNDPRVESWSSFADRVQLGLQRILDGCNGRSSRIAVFTSGGTISIVLQKALAIPDQKTLPLAWRLRNSAFCQVHWMEEAFYLSSFNETPHLPSFDWVTTI